MAADEINNIYTYDIYHIKYLHLRLTLSLGDDEHAIDTLRFPFLEELSSGASCAKIHGAPDGVLPFIQI